MKKAIIIAVILITTILLFGFLKIWPHTNIFGTENINSYEYFFNCWMGDVRMCDLDPFDRESFLWLGDIKRLLQIFLAFIF